MTNYWSCVVRLAEGLLLAGCLSLQDNAYKKEKRGKLLGFSVFCNLV